MTIWGEGVVCGTIHYIYSMWYSTLQYVIHYNYITITIHYGMWYHTLHLRYVVQYI